VRQLWSIREPPAMARAKLSRSPISRRPRATEVDRLVGQRVRMRRHLLGMSQGDLAARLGCSFQQVQKYENGSNRVSASMLSKTATALSVPIAFFFDEVALEGTAGRDDGLPADLLNNSETFDLLRAYYKIGSVELRTRALALLKAIAANTADDDR
jgi:transcriptional regulator with XRE-family HTH domain